MARNLDNRLGKLEAAKIGPLMGRRAALISQLANCIIATFKPEFIERCAGFFTDPLSVNAEDRARIEHMPIPDDLKAGLFQRMSNWLTWVCRALRGERVSTNGQRWAIDTTTRASD